MPQQTYEIQGRDGQTYEIQSDHQPTRVEVSQALSRVSGYQQQSDQIDQEVTRWKSIGVPTDDMGVPNSGKGPTTFQQLMYDMRYPSPGKQLAGDVAAFGTGFLAPAPVPRRPVPAAAVAESPSVPRMLAKGIIKKVTGLDADEIAIRTANLDRQSAQMRLRAARLRSARQPAQAEPAPVAAAAPAARDVNLPAELRLPPSSETPPATAVGPEPGASPARVEELQQKFGGVQAATPASATPPSAAASAQEAPAAGSAARVSTAPDLTKAKPETIRGLVSRWAGRSGLSLTPRETETAVQMVQQGAKPSEVVEAIAKRRSGGTRPMATPEAEGVPTAPAERMIYDRLRKTGASHEDALAHLQQARALSQSLGTPSVEEAVDRTVRRNVTGRWPDE
jgi:hypothetical protein